MSANHFRINGGSPSLFDYTWTLGGSTTATTGAGTAITFSAATAPSQWTVYLQTPGSSLSTATIRFEGAESATGTFTLLGASTDVSLSSAAQTQISFSGPHLCVRPYLVTLGSTDTVVKIRAIGV